MVDQAIKLWHDALGDGRGVEFVYTNGNTADPTDPVPAGVCRGTRFGHWAVNVPFYTVQIISSTEGGASYSGIGYIPPEKTASGNMVPQARLSFDPTGRGMEISQNIVSLAHELSMYVCMSQRVESLHDAQELERKLISFSNPSPCNEGVISRTTTLLTLFLGHVLGLDHEHQ